MFNDIYEIRDIGTKTRFFFIGDSDFKPDKSLPSYTTKLIPHMISDIDTVSVIKKKIMAFARKDITHHQMSLWAEFKPESVPSLTVSRIIVGHGEKNITKGNYLKIENGVLKKYKASLGYQLENSNKIMVIDPDPMTLPDTVSPELIKPFTTRDNNHQVLGSLPKIKQENGVYVINFLDHDNYLKQVSASPEKNLVVLDFYFNGHKNTSIEGEAAKVIQSQTEKMLIEKSNVLTELKESYNKNAVNISIQNDRVNNLVLAFNRPYSYYLDDNMEFNSEHKLNLSELFKRFTVDSDIPFVKYKDLDRKVSYKIDTQSLITRETDKGLDNFLKITRDNISPASFFQPFDYGKLEPVLKKREMLGWSVDKVLYRERQVRINERAEIELPIPGDTEMLTFKMKLSTSIYALMKFDYCDVILKRDGSVTVKFLDLNNKILIGEGDQLVTELNLIKQNIKTKIIPLISNKYNLDIEAYIKPSNNLPVVNVENIFDVMTDTTKEEKTIPLIQWIIKNKFSEYFTYRLNKKRPNNIYLKYHRVNNFENFENIRNNFLKMKELSLGIQQFNREWVERSNNLFNLCENESTEILTLLTESITKKQDLKIREYQNYHIDIVIKKKSEFEYTVIVDNATSFSELNSIKRLIQTLFSYDKKPQARVLVNVAKEAEKPTLEEKMDVTFKKTTTFEPVKEDDDEFDEFDEFSEFSESVEVEESDAAGVEDSSKDSIETLQQMEEVLEEETLTDNVTEQKKRDFMKQMRNLDAKMFNYPKSSDYNSYSQSCPAVDDRQPIILSKSQFDKVKNKNPEWMEENSKMVLEWGSSKETKKFYICARLFCVKCMMPLLMKQLLPDKSTGKPSGTCPFCKGSIIKNDTITDKNTIIVRRYKTKNKNYWEDVDVIKREVKTFFNNKLPKDATDENYWYTEIVRDSSKAAIPKLLSPESHPDGLCAPCCFKFKSNEVNKNIEKCAIHHVQEKTDLSDKERLKKLQTELPTDSQIMITNGNDIKLTTETGGVSTGVFRVNASKGLDRITKFTDIEISPINSMVFTVEATGESFKYSNDTVQPLENKNVLPKGYIFNQDKMPLMEQRYGFLPDKLNDLLLTSSANILDGEVRLDANVFLRKGVEKNNKYSFISAIGSYFKMSGVELVKHILKHLTLADFIRINNGDLVKYFSLNTESKDIPVNILSNFLENPENASLFKKIDASPQQQITLCYAYNYFKKYIGNMNISKDYKMLWHMFSVPLDLSQNEKIPLLKNGLNIIIIEKKIENEKELLSILNPPRANHYSEDKNTILLFKFNDYFEPIVLRSVTGGHNQGGLKEVFIKYFRFDTDLLPDKFNYDGNALILSKMYSNLKKILMALIKMSKRNIKQSGSLVYDRLPTISEVNNLVKMDKLQVNRLVIDNFIKGVGVLVKCLDTQKLIYIETRAFNPLEITIKTNLIKLDNLNKIENSNTINLQKLIESYKSLADGVKLSVKNIVIREGKIIAAVNNLGTKVILEPQVYDKTKVDIPLYPPSINFKLFISEEEMDKKGTILNKDDTIKYVKYSFSQIMSNPRNKAFLNKVNQIIKEDIADNIKRSKLNKIFNVVINGICGTSKTLVIYGENVIFEECNILKINKHPKLSQIITEDIIRSKLKRNELLNGTYSNPRFESVKGKIIDEDDFLMFVERHFSNNNNIYQYIDNTYSDLSRKTRDKTLLDIIPDIPEIVPEIIHNKKSITKSINAKISPGDKKTKRCVFPFKYKDMIYKNCINYRELGPQPVCAIDTKGKNKYGICPGEPVPVSQLKSFTKTKRGSNDLNSNSNSDKFYSVKPKVSKKIKLKTKVASITKDNWEGPFKDMEVSGDIQKPKKKHHKLEDAIKEAEEINKDGIKYDSIVKLGEKHFQLRKAKLADRFIDRDLWLLKSEKDRIMSVKPKKKRTIKVKKILNK